MAWYHECYNISNIPKKEAEKILKITDIEIKAKTFRHVPGEDYPGTFIKFIDNGNKKWCLMVPVDLEHIEDSEKYRKKFLKEMKDLVKDWIDQEIIE